MFKSTITSKGQLTIPKEIRELLHLSTGDGVVFRFNDESNIVTFEKDRELIECPICKGYGEFAIGNQPCFFCDQTKYIKASISAWEQIGLIKSLKYGISISVIQQETGVHGEFIQLQIPKVELYSNKYFDQLLDIAHDYLQMKLIEEYAPRSLSEPEKFMNPSDIVLDEILALLKQDVSKEKVLKWFRYERNVFTQSETQST